MNIAEFFLFLALPVITGVYLFLKKKYSYFEENEIPYVKPSMIMGNLSGVGTKYHMSEVSNKIYNECKGKDVVAGFYTLFSPSLIVTDLEFLKQVTIKDFNSFVDRGVFVNEDNEPLTGHLFAIGGEKWRFLRNKLSPVFTSGKIKMMYHTISDKGEAFIKAIEKTSELGSVDMKDISTRYLIDVISNCAFGFEANTLNHENDELISAFRRVLGEEGNGVLHVLFLFAFPNFSKLINLKQFDKVLTKLMNDIITESVTHRETNEIHRNDFLNMLIELKNKGTIDGEISTDTRKLTLLEVIAQAFVFFLAGSDTSSTVIAFAIMELGLHPEIQEKLRKEVLEKTNASDGEITYENLHEMTFLGQVVNETMRKYPPAFTTTRQAVEDYKIPDSKHVVKKGTQVMIPIISIHYDERYWKNPQDFDPDRFTVEEISKRPHLSFLPFGEGPRNCIGMRFAQVNVKFAIATVIKIFKVELDRSKVEVPLKFDPKSTNLEAKGGFWVKFSKL